MPVDFNGTIELQSSIKGYPENQGFNHWERLDQSKTEQGIWLQIRTRSSRIELGIATSMISIGSDAQIQVTNTPGYPTLTTSYLATAGQTVTVGVEAGIAAGMGLLPECVQLDSAERSV